MHVIACIKQVPNTTNVHINPETNTLMREGVESILNPFDEYALEEALRLKDAHGARVTAITMGPPQADVVLREAMARGADDGVLLTDRAFAGADTLATSYAVAQACGLNGSPTKVVRIFAPSVKTGGVRMDGRGEPAAAIDAVLKILREKGVA